MHAKAGLANLITGTRILCSAALLFCPAFSAPFYVLYLMAGLTDMAGGEHWFHTEEQMQFLDDWIRKNEV